MSLESVLAQIEEHMDLDELVYYLEEKEQTKVNIVRALRSVIYVHLEDLLEDYPWLED